MPCTMHSCRPALGQGLTDCCPGHMCEDLMMQGLACADDASFKARASTMQPRTAGLESPGGPHARPLKKLHTHTQDHPEIAGPEQRSSHQVHDITNKLGRSKLPDSRNSADCAQPAHKTCPTISLGNTTWRASSPRWHGRACTIKNSSSSSSMDWPVSCHVLGPHQDHCQEADAGVILHRFGDDRPGRFRLPHVRLVWVDGLHQGPALYCDCPVQHPGVSCTALSACCGVR